MSKIRNHAIGATLTAATLAAVLLTGCAGTEDDDDCREDESMSASLILGRGTGGSSGSKPSTGTSRVTPVPRPAPSPGKSPTKPSVVAPAKPSTVEQGSTSKPKAPKVKIDDEDCD